MYLLLQIVFKVAQQRKEMIAEERKRRVACTVIINQTTNNSLRWKLEYWWQIRKSGQMFFKVLKPDSLSSSLTPMSHFTPCWGQTRGSPVQSDLGQGEGRVPPETSTHLHLRGPLLWKEDMHLCMQICLEPCAYHQRQGLRKAGGWFTWRLRKLCSANAWRSDSLCFCSGKKKKHGTWEHRDDIPWHSMRFMCHKADLKFDVQLTWRWIGCHKHWWHHITNDAKYSCDGGDIEQCRTRNRMQSSFSKRWRKSW